MKRNEKEIKYLLDRWINLAVEDPDLADELNQISGDQEKVTDAFYRELEFGTGGLRGVIGAGTNRMNIYTVARASMGLAYYICKQFEKQERFVAISYDSRIKSDVFSKVAAGVFAACGIHVYIYEELMPTPMLSWAVRQMKCAGGIMVTASHNPSKYNGYKVYGADGCQITTKAASEILEEIKAVDPFDDVRMMEFEKGVASGMISYIGEGIIRGFVEEIKGQSLLAGYEKPIAKDMAIVYSPLNGTGLKPVLRTLEESGFSNLIVVEQQEKPDGRFPTCPYPNPEIKEAMALGIEYAKHYQAELLLATDPDCDRVGIAVRDKAGEYTLLTGNETGLLLLDYICKRRVTNGTMPSDPVFIKTIVTTDLAERIAEHYGVHTLNVLTGFKFIGEQIGFLEAKGHEKDYIFGFEESYGYLSGSYVRDKDAVGGVFLICEMLAYYHAQGVGLLEVLDGIYQEYGYCLNTLHSYEFEGVEGFDKMNKIMVALRGLCVSLNASDDSVRDIHIGEKKVLAIEDYLIDNRYMCDGVVEQIQGLPASDVLKFQVEGNASLVVRPSGTEPKLKMYVSVSAKDKKEALAEEEKLVEDMKRFGIGVR